MLGGCSVSSLNYQSRVSHPDQNNPSRSSFATYYLLSTRQVQFDYHRSIGFDLYLSAIWRVGEISYDFGSQIILSRQDRFFKLELPFRIRPSPGDDVGHVKIAAGYQQPDPRSGDGGASARILDDASHGHRLDDR